MNIKNKWVVSIIAVIVVVVSMILGWLILGRVFKHAFIVWKYNDSVYTAQLIWGKVQGFTSSASGNLNGTEVKDNTLRSIDQFKSSLEGIHNNKDAIDAMTKHISSNGGFVISSICWKYPRFYVIF